MDYRPEFHRLVEHGPYSGLWTLPVKLFGRMSSEQSRKVDVESVRIKASGGRIVRMDVEYPAATPAAASAWVVLDADVLDQLWCDLHPFHCSPLRDAIFSVEADDRDATIAAAFAELECVPVVTLRRDRLSFAAERESAERVSTLLKERAIPHEWISW